jgi:CRP/FNR family transcriptional regulator
VTEREEIEATVRSCPLFAELDANEACAVEAEATLHCVSAGTELFAEGSPARGLWLANHGRLRVGHSGLDGRQQVVAFPARGEPLDLAAALDGGPHGVSAVAAEAVTVVLVPAPVFAGLVARHQGVARNALQVLCAQLRQREISGALGVLRGAQERVGCTLLQLARQYGGPGGDGQRIDYRLSRQDIADRTGIRLETAIRALSEMTNHGLIRTIEQHIELVDVGGLREATGCADCQFDCSVFQPLNR